MEYENSLYQYMTLFEIWGKFRIDFEKPKKVLEEEVIAIDYPQRILQKIKHL